MSIPRSTTNHERTRRKLGNLKSTDHNKDVVMASQEGSRANTPGGVSGGGDDSFPQMPGKSSGPPSIISSRMTDIGTEDGREIEAQTQNTQRHSLRPSQPDTIQSAASSQRVPAAWPQPTPLRRGLSGKRASVAGSIGANSTATGGRPASAASRSHVPSISSHSFFRPMSSQKLQAQRGVARPSTRSRHVEVADYGSTDDANTTIGANVVRRSIVSNTASGHHITDEPPPSRGTEMTGRETFDRHTANTSPTGHYASPSVSESVRPLRKQTAENKGLTVKLDNNFRNQAQPSPLTPHSLRSNFLSRSNAGENGSNRNMAGGEKLGSVDSSPDYAGDSAKDRSDADAKSQPVRRDFGRNWEYFTGNTVFCAGGRLQNTRSRPVNVITGACLVIPTILFFVFSAYELWYYVSPAVPIIFAYLSFICISSFLHASLTDPGVSISHSIMVLVRALTLG